MHKFIDHQLSVLRYILYTVCYKCIDLYYGHNHIDVWLWYGGAFSRIVD